MSSQGWWYSIDQRLQTRTRTIKHLLEYSFSHIVQGFGNLTSYNELTLGQYFCSFTLSIINFSVIIIIISCHLLLWGLDSCSFSIIFKCIIQLFICDLSGLSMLSPFPVRTALAVSLRLVRCAFVFIFLLFSPFEGPLLYVANFPFKVLD